MKNTPVKVSVAVKETSARFTEQQLPHLKPIAQQVQVADFEAPSATSIHNNLPHNFFLVWSLECLTDIKVKR